MARSVKLNLIGVVSPFCILEFKSALARIRPLQVLEVMVRDPDVAADLIRIVKHSPDRLVSRKKTRGHYLIRVERKGARKGEGKEET